ncbi:MAG: hypothetical protein INQ03_15325 [Candidatus Heimdallarchaeota archaeon]|nr:hypothetical protein [Candidatus Heimdallarchaeota archaeon]
MPDKLPFIVLAGSPRERDALMEYADTDYKTLIEINGKPLINYVLDQIVKSNRAEYILITGLPEDRVTLPDGFDHNQISFYHVEGPVVEKIYGASMHLFDLMKKSPEKFNPDNKHAVIISGDIPCVNLESFDFVFEEFNKYPDFEYYHTVVHQEIMETTFPGSKRSWIHIKGGNNYCGGDIDIAFLPSVKQKYQLIKVVTENRKLFVKALFKLSPFFFIRYLFRRIDVKEAEEIVTRLFEMRSKIFISPYAELGFDVDKPHQLEMAQSYLDRK